MEFLEVKKEKTGEETTAPSNSQIYVKVSERGSLFSLYDKDYHSLGLDEDYNLYYCEKGATTLEIKKISYDDLFEAIEKKVCMPKVDEDYLFVDEDLLKEEELEQYIKLKDAMNEIINSYAPDFSYIVSKTYKTHLKELAKSCNLSYRKFRSILTRFFTSGMKNYALLSKRSAAFGDRRKRDKPYSYTQKTGRKIKDSEGNIINQGIIITDEIKDEILSFSPLVIEGLSMRQAYTRYNTKVYIRENAFEDGNLLLEDKAARPTFAQFSYIMKQNISNKEKTIGKKGYLGYYNDHRALNGDTLSNVYFPGDVVDIDAWEADISLVREGSSTDVAGRPTVYLMVDRFTRAIVAFYAGYEVNSYQGLSSLMMNLIEDKEELFKKYGLNMTRDKIPMPESFIPGTVVTDNGADFKSEDFRNLLSDLNIQHQIAPPRSGSAKGLVERTFGEFAHDHKDIFKGAGLIKKEYGSKYHEEAILTLKEYTKFLLLAIIKHNLKVMPSYPIHDRELLDKDISISPISLWNYFTKEKCLKPRPIIDRDNFFFSIMRKVKASITREGIIFEGLIYDIGEDQNFQKLQEKEKAKELDFRLDPRDVSRLYYIDGSGKLTWAELSKSKASNKLFFNVSYSEFIYTKKEIRDKRREAEEANDNLQAATSLLSDFLVEDAKNIKKKEAFEKNNTKNIKEFRREEKFDVARSEKISHRLDSDVDEEDECEVVENVEQQALDGCDFANSESYEEFEESLL